MFGILIGICLVTSITSILFTFIWPGIPLAFIITAIVAMIFDAQFILIQRYNRPRALKILEKEKKKEYVKI